VGSSVGLLALLFFAERVSHGELSKRLVLVRARLTRLVEERNRRMDDAEAFYESPEWKAVRAAVIEEQGASCRDCGTAIDSDGEVTVGHRLARSEYPHLALSRDNLRVLCRSCNSRKRGRELD
jgi:5-methylcytosine-specific restriction endonuclease McrA